MHAIIPSIASIFLAKDSCSSGLAQHETISQISHSISTIFPPTKSQANQSLESRQGCDEQGFYSYFEIVECGQNYKLLYINSF